MPLNFRHEWKHPINYSDLLALRQRLRCIASMDAHAPEGSYQVRSLYFDSPADRALRDKLDGISRREKFRLRYYNGDPSLIRLEKKSKMAGLCAKESTLLSLPETQSLLAGQWQWMQTSERPLVRELFQKMTCQGLRPKTLVDYTREAFVYPAGNVRVTLDYDIRTGLHSTDFLNPCVLTVPAGEDPIILEVKWDEFLPQVIQDAVQLKNRRVSAFSKYALCRIYD